MQGNDTELREIIQQWLKKVGLGEVTRIAPGLLTPAQVTEYTTDPSKIRSNPSIHKLMDRLLKAGPGADFDEIVRANSGLQSIDNETYGKLQR